MSGSSRLQIGFVGGGNMATALIGGLAASDPDGFAFTVIEPFEEARAKLGQFSHLVSHPAPHADLTRCDALVMAVKPQQFASAAAAVAPYAAGKLVVSIAAGIRCGDIARWLGGAGAIVRTMPNTPALIRAGITGLYAAPGVTAEQRALADRLLAAVGATVWVEREEQLDAVTAVSGSGPAYVFYFIEALERGALELGLDAKAARSLALATFLGASRLANESDEPPAILRERVTSKGGTTYAALTSMQGDGVDAAIGRALQAAARRSVELADEFGKL